MWPARSLALGFLALACGCPAALGADPSAAAPTDEPALRQRVRDLRHGLRDVPLPLVIEELSGCTVRPWQDEFRGRFTAVAESVIASINPAGVMSARVNEAGNAVEDVVLDALRSHGFHVERPAGPSGRSRAAGYPDLLATSPDDGTAFYIEVKTYSSSTEDSTQRSFYLSPSDDFKVTRDAIHLLIAVELERGGEGRYRAVSVRWLDLRGLRCDLKHEFNASNRDLYRAASGLVLIEAGHDSSASSAETEPGAPR